MIENKEMVDEEHSSWCIQLVRAVSEANSSTNCNGARLGERGSGEQAGEVDYV